MATAPHATPALRTRNSRIEREFLAELAKSQALSRRALAAINALAVTQQRLAQMLDQTAQLRGAANGPSATAHAPRAKRSPDLEGLRGQEQLVAWSQDGTLLPSTEFARRWGMKRQALAKKAADNKLFGVKVGRGVFYPAALARLPQAFAESLCVALAPVSASRKLIFLLRPHGSLGGKTVAHAVEAGQEARALALAASWAAEHGQAAT